MKQKAIITGIILAIVISVMAILVKQQSPKLAYVNNVTLFEEFQGKKELEGRLSSIERSHQAKMDSMQMQLNHLNRNAKANDVKAVQVSNRQQAYYQKRQEEFSAAFQEQSNTYTKEIWNQINQYVKEYGAENGYDFIYGVSGDGSLMYSKVEKDITQDVLKYINKKYEGI